ncbi:MAG: response regulator [Spirochaetales bacterium]|uniref:Response regulator n=1 Tax=Candidatus Thalassospirochaeta sargassi TaxID=3119039 RepID=A0AAJ1IA97_9SPIO|nr:response regulator [Spirochaetales bacterium]
MNKQDPDIEEKTVLIIDDEDIIRASTSAMLMDLGYKALIAEDGERGVEIFKVNRKDINLVIMDIIMPRMGGLEAFEKIKKIDPDVKVIVTSGFPREDRFEAFIDGGAVAVMKKPYRRKVMAELLSEHI